MSVQLGILKNIGNSGDRQIEVWASNYDDDELYLLAGDDACQVELTMDRRQLQELTVIIDRFLDR